MSCPEKHCTQPHVLKEEVTATGKWLRLEKTTYVDPSGSTRIWETVKRTTRPTDTDVDGVGIIAILKRTLHKDCVVLVKQFRPPMGRYTLEFPAGLIDQNENSETAALRELKEETGYKGEVVGVTPVLKAVPSVVPCAVLRVVPSVVLRAVLRVVLCIVLSATCLDPGLSNCSTRIVMVNINGDDPENINPTQQLGDGEFVDVILLPLDEFQRKINELLKKEELVVDSKVYIYAMGMSQAFFKPNELPVLKQ